MSDLIVQSLIGAVFVYAFYLLPSIIAFIKKKKNKVAILIFNIFLGWTILGWIGALIWSATND